MISYNAAAEHHHIFVTLYVLAGYTRTQSFDIVAMPPPRTLQKTDFQPKTPPATPKAAQLVPKFIYCDPKNPNSVDIREDFYGSRRMLRIGVLGAGISLLNFLHYLFELVPEESVEVVVYDKNEDVGGVVCWHSSISLDGSG